MMKLRLSSSVALLIASASTATAQYGGYGGYGGSGNSGSGSGSGSNSGGFGNGGGFASFANIGREIQQRSTTHGIIMSIAFAFMLPFGAAMMRFLRVKGSAYIHGGWMVAAYLLVLVGFGFGVWLAHTIGLLHRAHPIIGIVVTAFLLLQPLPGLIAHWRYAKHGRGLLGLFHRWNGRVFITLGVINGGLGIHLANQGRELQFTQGKHWVIAYTVVAVIFFGLWYSVSIYDWWAHRRHASRQWKEKRVGSESSYAGT